MTRHILRLPELARHLGLTIAETRILATEHDDLLSWTAADGVCLSLHYLPRLRRAAMRARS